MGTVEIWVDEKTMKMLDATITELKKHGKGRASYDDAINHLLDTFEELQAKKRALVEQAQACAQRK